MTKTPLTREQIDAHTGAQEIVQLTRDELAKLPPAERLQAWRAGQCSGVIDEIEAASSQRTADARALFLKQHPQHAHLFKETR